MSARKIEYNPSHSDTRVHHLWKYRIWKFRLSLMRCKYFLRVPYFLISCLYLGQSQLIHLTLVIVLQILEDG